MLPDVGHRVIGSPYVISRALLSFVQKHNSLWAEKSVTHIHHKGTLDLLHVKVWLRNFARNAQYEEGAIKMNSADLSLC